MLTKFVTLLFFVAGAVAQDLPSGWYLISSADRRGYVSANELDAPIVLQNPHHPGGEAQWNVTGTNGRYTIRNTRYDALASVIPAAGNPVIANSTGGNLFEIEKVEGDSSDPPRYTIKALTNSSTVAPKFAWTLQSDNNITAETPADASTVQQWSFTAPF